jgi:hypothetical protein
MHLSDLPISHIYNLQQHTVAVAAISTYLHLSSRVYPYTQELFSGGVCLDTQ